MNRFLPLLLAGLLAGALLTAFLLPRRETSRGVADPIHRAFARAMGYYLNETNADYRRARLELEPLLGRLGGSAAYHLDMALIDLQEINFRVQDQSRILPTPDYRRLLQSALRHLERARALAPENDAVAYNLARTYLKLAPEADNDAELIDAAERLLIPLTREKPPDPSTLLLYGDLRWDRKDVEGASAAFKRIVDLGEDYVPRTLYYVALSKLEQTYRRLDPSRADAVRKIIERDFSDRPKGTSGALERGRYTAFLQLAEHPRTVPDPRGMNWMQLTVRTGIPAIGAPPFFAIPDLDNDCARDLVIETKGGMRVLRNLRNAVFHDMTRDAKLPMDLAITCAAAGDLDGDGRTDLVVGGSGGLRIFMNATPFDDPTRWEFAETTRLPGGEPLLDEASHAPVACVTLWDLDHDGDLDIFAGGRPNRVYRTVVEQPQKGPRYVRFANVTAKLGMDRPPATQGLILDVEDDDDTDLFVSGPQGNAWFENLRELTFARHPLPAGNGLEAADVDNDLREELRIGGTVYKYAAGRFDPLFQRRALLDLDGDGVVESEPFSGLVAPGDVLAARAADLNRDGSRDLFLLTPKGLDVYMSQPDRPAAWIDVQPRGLKTNEMGIGTRLQLFASGLRIGTTCRDGLVSFGLGRRTVVDSILVRWTNGVEQGLVTPKITSCLEVEEREGEVGSCPFLYTYAGGRWNFIADCNSGTPLGLPYADGKFLPPRSNESIFIPGKRLQAEKGRFRIDLSEEFRELFYVDHVVLRAIDHPAGTRPVLNEGFRMRPPPFAVHCLADLRPPRAARDWKGRDILALVRAKDGRHAAVFEKLDSRYTGLAWEWSIDLDFGDLSGAKRILLVMDGWVEFPTASASIASSQSKTVAFEMPVIEAMGDDGTWRVVDPDAGFPAGKGKAVLVDLTGKIPAARARIRIRSTQRLHWDAFQISTEPDRPMRLTVLPLASADQEFRGIGERIEDPSGELPWRYSHDKLVSFYRWDQMPEGMLTRYGDVLPLLAEIDDRYPIVASGDVIHLAFDAAALPALPKGWVRDFCFTTEGWVKDADMNQAIRESVTPLPFHGMGSYPYDTARKRYPHPDFVKQWFTRPARKLVNPEALR